MKRVNSSNVIVLMFLYCSLFLGVAIFHKFSLFRVPALYPTFTDLRLITSASQCSLIHPWNMNSLSCDPWGRAFNYPSIWVRIFAFLHIKESQTNLLGYLEIILLCVALTYWIQIGNTKFSASIGRAKYLLLVVLMLFSPPVLLLMERGNIDMFIFSGITLFYFLFEKRIFFLSAPLLALLGALKFYPFSALAWVLGSGISKSKKIVQAVLSLLGFGFIFKDLSLIAARSELPWTFVSYGVSQLFLGASQKLHHLEGRILGAIISLSIFSFAVLVVRISFRDSLLKFGETFRGDPLAFGIFRLFSILFLGSYLLGTSFDYRLVVLIPVAIALTANIRNTFDFSLALFLVISIFYGGHLAPLIFNIGSDFVMFVFSVLLFSFNLSDWSYYRSKKN